MEIKKPHLAVLIIAVIILIIRKTDAFFHPQFWAEDGTIFFLQQYEHGLSALFQPYAGYLHMIPRLIALFADSFFSYSAIPAVYNFSSLVITLFVITNIFSPRLEIRYKELFALTIVLIPHFTNEVFMNITNIQWIISILLIITLMKECPNNKYGNIHSQFIFDIIIVILCGLTGPFIIFLLPLFVLKWSKNMNLYNSLIMILACIISLLQLSFILSAEIGGAKNVNIILDFNIYSSLIGHKIFGNLFLGKDISYTINNYFLSIIYFALIFILACYSSQKKFINIFLYIHLIILLATLYKFKSNPEILISAGNGIRYFYIPYIMITWSLIALLDQKGKWEKALTAIALTLILASSLSSGFHSKLIDYQWPVYSKSIGKKDVMIPINPKGWQIFVKNHK